MTKKKRKEKRGQGRGDDHTREFMRACLRAIMHVRRQPIDAQPWRYDTDMLQTLPPFKLAAYTVALTVTGHEDAEEARASLLEVGDERLLRLVDLVVAHLRS